MEKSRIRALYNKLQLFSDPEIRRIIKLPTAFLMRTSVTNLFVKSFNIHHRGGLVNDA
jgi:hypothetical protein